MKRHKYLFEKRLKKVLKVQQLRKVSLLYLKNNSTVNVNIRQYITSILFDRYRLLSLNRLKLFCLITGRTRFVLKYFRISRMSIKENLSRGYGVGFYKK